MNQLPYKLKEHSGQVGQAPGDLRAASPQEMTQLDLHGGSCLRFCHPVILSSSHDLLCSPLRRELRLPVSPWGPCREWAWQRGPCSLLSQPPALCRHQGLPVTVLRPLLLLRSSFSDPFFLAPLTSPMPTASCSCCKAADVCPSPGHCKQPAFYSMQENIPS